jgi:DNA-binding CsgD family transcriptional regulator
MGRFAAEQDFARFADRFCAELDRAERDRLRQLLLDEDRGFASRAEQLDKLDIQLARCKERIAKQRAIVGAWVSREGLDQELGRSRHLLSRLIELHDLFEEYREALAEEPERSPVRGAQLPRADSERHDLSRREIEVLHHVSRGRPSREIAVLLNITERTVAMHRQSICAKLKVVNSAAAVGVAIRTGILKL